MTMPSRLLAKSYDREKHGSSPPDYALLVQHSRDVAAACDALADVVGQTALSNCQLGPELFEPFRLALRASGWIQDLGKASSHFQEMVTPRPLDGQSLRQLVRHETISGLLVWLEELSLRHWLNELTAPNRELASPTLPPTLFLAMLWGAIGHHRKFDEDTKPAQGTTALTVEVTHTDFAEVLTDMSNDLGLSSPSKLLRDVVIVRSRREASSPNDLLAYESIRKLQTDFKECEVEFSGAAPLRMLALIKAFGIAADVAASAVARRGEFKGGTSLTQYVTDYIRDKLDVGLTNSDISRLINKWAWKSREQSTGERASANEEATLPADFVIYPFQNAVAASAASKSYLTLAEAGCGSGKSLAAYLWAREWCDRFTQQGRNNFRLFFCLPTTGTTTEHFRDYALESGIDDIALVHSRVEVDLEEMTQTAPQEDAEGIGDNPANAAGAALNAMRDRIEALELWSTPLVVSTTDTVLGLMANARRSIYSLPAIMNSAIVFDEIHAFDDVMFGHLLVFLKNFPCLPVLLMTASLPEKRRHAIRQVRDDLNVIPGPPGFETLARYLINDVASDDEIWREIEECVAARGKVLWVCNRVEWANQTYSQIRKCFPDTAANIYHSRFRYRDRSRRHRTVIDDFKVNKHGPGKAAILVATQVAEMSLDLSADLLITDIAPIPSLIQRMGRLNRRAKPNDPPQERQPKLAFVRSLPESVREAELPYNNLELEVAKTWLAALGAKEHPLSQRDLSNEFATLNEVKECDFDGFWAKAQENACFFSGLWRTRPGETRGDGHTVSVVLEKDVKTCIDRDRRGQPTPRWIRAYEVSIPYRNEVLGWKRVGNIREAPGAAVVYDYDEKTKEGTGARWRKKEDV